MKYATLDFTKPKGGYMTQLQTTRNMLIAKGEISFNDAAKKGINENSLRRCAHHLRKEKGYKKLKLVTGRRGKAYALAA